MKIPFDRFAQYIDETILKRGLSYYKNGYVHEPEEIDTGEYEVIVEGTEDYTVHLKLKNGFITRYACDCPYDMGPVCKHVVAVIFYLNQNESEMKKKPNTGKKSTPGKPATRKTVAELVNEVLEKPAMKS